MSNKLLERSGFCLQAVDIISDQIESLINQNLAVKPRAKDLNEKDKKSELKAIDNSIVNMKKLSKLINKHDENDNKVVNKT